MSHSQKFCMRNSLIKIICIHHMIFQENIQKLYNVYFHASKITKHHQILYKTSWPISNFGQLFNIWTPKKLLRDHLWPDFFTVFDRPVLKLRFSVVIFCLWFLFFIFGTRGWVYYFYKACVNFMILGPSMFRG